MMSLNADNRLTPSLENSLKAIYLHTDDQRPVTSADVATSLGISQPSVTELFRRLAEQGLIEYTPYRGATLTANGLQVTLAVLRRHRLLETFLVEVLGYTWDEVHAEADALEHAVSDTLAARIAAYLDHPQLDPHGDPIPTPEGSLPPLAVQALSSLRPGTTARLARVIDQTPARLNYLAQLGLVPGVEIVCIGQEPFAGPLTIEVEGQRQIIAASLADTLLVADPRCESTTMLMHRLCHPSRRRRVLPDHGDEIPSAL
jgi:DtxR family transcriptional regulator, Mn-dependent transcriptional regulator